MPGSLGVVGARNSCSSFSCTVHLARIQPSSGDHPGMSHQALLRLPFAEHLAVVSANLAASSSCCAGYSRAGTDGPDRTSRSSGKSFTRQGVRSRSPEGAAPSRRPKPPIQLPFPPGPRAHDAMHARSALSDRGRWASELQPNAGRPYLLEPEGAPDGRPVCLCSRASRKQPPTVSARFALYGPQSCCGTTSLRPDPECRLTAVQQR